MKRAGALKSFSIQVMVCRLFRWLTWHDQAFCECELLTMTRLHTHTPYYILEILHNKYTLYILQWK